jgi:hypothetical protein
MAKLRLQIAALAVVITAAIALLVLPTSTSVTSSSDGSEVTTSQTLLASMGPSVLLILAAPIAMAALPLFSRGRAWVALSIASAVLLWLFVILGLLTIGVFFLPGAILALIAACRPVRAPAAAT